MFAFKNNILRVFQLMKLQCFLQYHPKILTIFWLDYIMSVKVWQHSFAYNQLTNLTYYVVDYTV